MKENERQRDKKMIVCLATTEEVKTDEDRNFNGSITIPDRQFVGVLFPTAYMVNEEH